MLVILAVLGIASTSMFHAPALQEVTEIKEVEFSEIIQDGETAVYAIATDNNVYKTDFDESLLFVNEGDTINVSILSQEEIPVLIKN